MQTEQNKMNTRKLTSQLIKNVLCDSFCAQVKDLDCEGLFGNIESVLETSKKLLKNLENAVQEKEGKDQELGKFCIIVTLLFNFMQIRKC